ncbi:MAG: hypothetical protein ABUL55_02170 [Pseudomonadota bacterium]
MQNRRLKVLALVATAALSAGCSTGRTADTRRGVVGAAAIPMRDVGFMKQEIPPILRNYDYPYSTGTLSNCTAIAYEIGQLDSVLGPESFQPGPNRNIWDRSGDFAEQQTVAAAQDTAEGIIPFRSWVRRISGASAAEREALRAVANGQQRRTFLRGYGASMGCPGIVPTPPPPAHISRSQDDRPISNH